VRSDRNRIADRLERLDVATAQRPCLGVRVPDAGSYDHDTRRGAADLDPSYALGHRVDPEELTLVGRRDPEVAGA
jgi:hypothetical protein